MNSDVGNIPDIKPDKNGFYREEHYMDMNVAAIRRLVPGLTDGSDDPDRPVRFIGQTQLLTERGPLPVEFEINAPSLAEAIDAFSNEAKKAIEKMVSEVRRMQAEQASRIVVPKGGPKDGGIIV